MERKIFIPLHILLFLFSRVIYTETKKSIKDRFEHSEKILKIREKYYKEYSKFLTQKQIQRVYELEQKTMKRLGKRGHMKHGQHHSPNRKMVNPQAS